MNPSGWNPGSILEMSGYYWRTCALHAAVKLDIFSLIGEDQVTCHELSRKLKADKRGLEVLLDALASLELLIKKDDTYKNSQPSQLFLSKASPRYVGFMIMHHYHLMDSWHNIDKAVLEGGPIRDRSSFSDEEWRESFLMGMFNSGMAVAPEVSKIIDLSGCSHLLDLGGGPGTFAIHFCLANPKLKASVFDLDTTRPFAEDTIQKFKVSDRVNFIAGDYVRDTGFGKNKFDAAWLSHILHGEGPEQAAEIIKKAVQALKPDSSIFIHDFILDETKTAPAFAALFSMNMFLGTDDGRSYSQGEISKMLRAAGVKEIKRLDFTGPTQSGILLGKTCFTP